MPENPKSIVTTGFSNIHVALYAADGGNVTYTGVRKLGRSVSMSTDISTSDDNNFYADDRLAETETGSAFTDGSGTMTIDGLTPDDEAFLMGLKAGNPVQVDSSNSVETIAALIKSYFVRKYMAENNIMPEISESLKDIFDIEGQDQFVIDQGMHINYINKAIVSTGNVKTYLLRS